MLSLGKVVEKDLLPVLGRVVSKKFLNPELSSSREGRRSHLNPWIM